MRLWRRRPMLPLQPETPSPEAVEMLAAARVLAKLEPEEIRAVGKLVSSSSPRHYWPGVMEIWARNHYPDPASN
jgi:hypothetical protein